MNVPIEAIAVIGKQNDPILIKKFKTDAETNLKYDFIAHSCCDIINELVLTGKDLYLGLLCCMEDIACYGYCTNTKLKFIIMLTLQDKSIADSKIRALFEKMHEEYIYMNFNLLGTGLSAKFINCLEQLG
jgi:hypothetical protein